VAHRWKTEDRQALTLANPEPLAQRQGFFFFTPPAAAPAPRSRPSAPSSRLAHKFLQQAQLEYDASKADMDQKAAARRVRKSMHSIKTRAQDVRLALV
jgi:hypothetical protein